VANWDALEHRLFKSVPPTTPDAVRTTRAAERASASAGSGRAFSAALRSPPRGSKSVGRWHAGLAPPSSELYGRLYVIYGDYYRDL
jgi:hypothetical protein